MESTYFKKNKYDIILVGGGPANLTTASFLVKKGLSVLLVEQNAQIGKKWMVASKSGLNIGMDIPYSDFIANYYRDKEWIKPILDNFSPKEQFYFFEQVLDIKTTIGSAGKIFPDVSGKIFLKRWLEYLKENKLEIKTNTTWLNSKKDQHIFFSKIKNKEIKIHADYIVFGLGGGSWKETGSDGLWLNKMNDLGIETESFKASNSGCSVLWDDYIFDKFENTFLKNIRIIHKNRVQEGEIRITKDSIEGSPIYHLNNFIRKDFVANGFSEIFIDFKPQLSDKVITDKWNKKWSISKNCKNLKIHPIFPAIYKDLNTSTPAQELVKKFPLKLFDFSALDKSISTIGGIKKSALDVKLASIKNPNYYFNGEMVNWDAPTGGYLLSMCFAMGKYIAETIVKDYKED